MVVATKLKEPRMSSTHSKHCTHLDDKIGHETCETCGKLWTAIRFHDAFGWHIELKDYCEHLSHAEYNELTSEFGFFRSHNEC